MALLLQHSKIEVNAEGRWGETALLSAVERGQEGTVALLLPHSKIDPKAVNADNGFLKQPPLYEAVKNRNKL